MPIDHADGRRLFWAIVLLAAAIAVPARPDLFPYLGLVALFGIAAPIRRAWRAAGGTALRPAIVWASIAVGLAVLSQIVAISEPSATGRPLTGQVVYVSTLAAFAFLLSVLNARTPGGGAWAILMSLLVVVLLVPWLEGSGLVREGGGWDRLRLTAPWTIFYGLLVLAGVTNYLPTRFGQGAVWLGIGFVVEFLGLTRTDLDRPTRGLAWIVVPLCWAMAGWVAEAATTRSRRSVDALDRLWLWFRDAWGVVWAIRVQERFNRAAASAGWPIRLTWQGVAVEPGGEVPPDAWSLLAGLLRRFATEDRLREAAGVGLAPIDDAGNDEDRG